jgi:acetyl-CoA carboxylase biotin carboxyl carrier protein
MRSRDGDGRSAPVDVERVETLIKLLHGARARELLVETESWRISVTRGAAPPRPVAVVPSRTAPAAPEPDHEPPDRVWITAPLVGIFRPGAARLDIGDRVERGQTVGGIESMKIMNPLISEVEGEVTALPVEDGQPVEYGQPLIEIRHEEEA